MAKDFRKTRHCAGVYMISNQKNNRVYIGSALVLSRRKYEHFGKLVRDVHGNPFLQADFNKCGRSAFKFIVLEVTLPDECLSVEQVYLDQYFDNQDMCYNICPEARNTRGRKMSKEARRKISEAQLGEKNKWYGTTGPFHGKNHTKETRRRISSSMKGRATKTVVQISTGDGLKVVGRFVSVAEASRNTGISYSSIRNQLCGLSKSAGGFVWKYEETDE